MSSNHSLNHMHYLSLILLLILLPHSTISFRHSVTSLPVSTSTSTHNFQTDISSCPCNTTTSCNPFCCCDTACSQTLINQWGNNNLCTNQNVEIEKYCGQVGEEGHSAFQDLACVMYSNRGSIGSFYTLPSDIINPGVSKFSKTVQSSRITLIPTPTTPAASVAQRSGNPGYILGKPLIFSSTNPLYTPGDPLTRQCYSSGITNGTTLQVNFGVNTVFICSTSTSSATYIDNILRVSNSSTLFTNISINKYASQSTQVIQIYGINDQIIYQTYTLNILYSYAGWVMDPQNYVVAAKVIGQGAGGIGTKVLRIKWTKVQPQTIQGPPTNYFYQYFNYLWLPLRSKYDQFTSNEIQLPLLILATIGILIIL